jgi:hypothetical protein
VRHKIIGLFYFGDLSENTNSAKKHEIANLRIAPASFQLPFTSPCLPALSLPLSLQQFDYFGAQMYLCNALASLETAWSHLRPPSVCVSGGEWASKPLKSHCSLLYSGGRDHEDYGSKPAQANSFQDSASKKSFTHTQKGLVEWLKV